MTIGRSIKQLNDPKQVVVVSSQFGWALYLNGNLEDVRQQPQTIGELHRLVGETPITLGVVNVVLTPLSKTEGFTFPFSLGDLNNHKDVVAVKGIT